VAKKLNKYDIQHLRNLGLTEKQIASIFDLAVKEAAAIGASIHDFNPDKPFSFANYPQTKARIDRIIKNLQKKVEAVIVNGVRSEWTLANNKNNALCDRVFGGNKSKLTREQERKYYSNNDKALEAFQARKSAGMNLSDRVWSYTSQFKSEIEMGLDLGLRNGKPADEIARDLKQYLKEPNMLFRRVRDEHGQLRLSKAAKAYRPGAGVYRSSYKNAMRLARTETNMAYRTSDHTRWQQMDFVVGIEIHLSNNHTLNGRAFTDICDELQGKYPKTFKFTGWHPQCRCHAVAILKTPEELMQENEAILEGRAPSRHSVNEVKDVPEELKSWVTINSDRIAGAEKRGTLPYFLKDNYRDGKVSNGLAFQTGKVKPVRTPEQAAEIKKAWESRAQAIQERKNLVAEAKQYIDVDASTLESYLSKGSKTANIAAAQKRIEAELQSRKALALAYSETIPDALSAIKEYGATSTKNVYDAVTAKLKTFEGLTLEKQLEKLKYEVSWVEDNKKYNTWEIAKAAYEKQLGKVEYKLLEKKVDNLINTAKSINPKSNSKLAILLKNKVVSQDYMDKVTTEMNVLLVRRNKSIRNLANISEKEIEKLLNEFKKETVEGADNRLRGLAESIWKTLTLEERNVLTKYTQTYNYLNEPLRGLPYYGSKIPNAEHVHDLPILTKAISKFKMPQNTVVRRGIRESWTINELGYGLDKLKVGDVFVDKGFLSTAVHPKKGFTDLKYEFIVVVPKGAQGFYAEPFSHYTDYGKFTYGNNPKYANLWDGKSKEVIRGEQEWIGQRGSKLKVLKKIGNTIYLQLIGQRQ
jgi:hypothetical protein